VEEVAQHMDWRGLTKRWRQRLSAILLILALIVLVDELAKENYAFDVNDLVSPYITHEKIFTLLVLLALLLGVRRRG
jgi:succinate dehydrogenase hydrophobic anchor subunit